MKPPYVPILLPFRGLAALLVVLYHVGSTTGILSSYPPVDSTFTHGKHGVELFFLISGLVIPLSLISKGYKLSDIHRFVAKRSIRIEPTYLAAVTLSTFFILVREMVFRDGALTPPTALQFLSNVFYLVPFNSQEWLSPVFWTLGIELQFYLLCAVIFGLGVNWRANTSLIAVILISNVLPRFLSSGAFVFGWLDCFAVGFILALATLQFISRSKALLFIGSMHVIMLFTRPLFVVALLSLATLFILFKPEIQLGRLPNFLGKQSYSLYLTHCLTGTTVVNLSLRFMPDVALDYPGMAILVATAVSIALAQILYMLVEKPTESWSKRISLK